MMRKFREIMEEYGIDYQVTMGRFMDNEALYLKFLDMFFKDENMERLGKALESGDYKGAFEAAHTLKGVVANMGLDPLLKAVCAVVEPLRAKDMEKDYQSAYQLIREEYQKVEALRGELKGVV